MKTIPLTLSGFLAVLLIMASPTTIQAAESLWKRVLRVTGVSATPSQQKAGDDVEDGEIWIVNVTGGEPVRLSSAAGFRSPIFAADGKSVLAVKEESLWRVALNGGAATRLHRVPGLRKLVGIDAADMDKSLGLVLRDEKWTVGLLSITRGEFSELEFNGALSEDRQALAHLKGWDRSYGTTALYVKNETRPSLAGGDEEWSEVFLQRRKDAPIKVSRGNGTSCGQPSLSSDGRMVVFIKASRR